MAKNVNSAKATMRVIDVKMVYKTPTTLIKGNPARRSIARLKRSIGLQNHTQVHALKGVTFSAYQGEIIGLMGQNGSGKSTLMRIMAGVEPPTSGMVLAASQPSLLSINAALVPSLSGLKNIKLGLYAMSMTPHEVRQLIPKIAEFADLKEAINRPMRTYSSGMSARLRFAIAAAANPHILLLDEALGAGDAAFAERSRQAVEHLTNSAGTIIKVSHAAQEIEETCTRALWLHDGELIADGSAEETARKYRWWAWNKAKGEVAKANDILASARREYADTVAISKLQTLGPQRSL